MSANPDLFDCDDDEDGSRSPLPTPHSPPEEEPTAEDIAQQIIDLESQQRLWVKTCIAVVGMPRGEQESPKVEAALDSAIVAAAARMKRILGADGGEFARR